MNLSFDEKIKCWTVTWQNGRSMHDSCAFYADGADIRMIFAKNLLAALLPFGENDEVETTHHRISFILQITSCQQTKAQVTVYCIFVDLLT